MTKEMTMTAATMRATEFHHLMIDLHADDSCAVGWPLGCGRA